MIDSGCTNHMTGEREMLVEFVDSSQGLLKTFPLVIIARARYWDWARL